MSKILTDSLDPLAKLQSQHLRRKKKQKNHAKKTGWAATTHAIMKWSAGKRKET